jgi:hypothetical protein
MPNRPSLLQFAGEKESLCFAFVLALTCLLDPSGAERFFAFLPLQ